jgi:L-fuculokinase
MKIPVIAIFDVGKTNKKAFLFNRHYQIVWEESVTLAEITDEDGDACEDIALLTDWVLRMFESLTQRTEFDIKAVNFSTYGASWVHIGADGQPVAPLYNYLKPYPAELSAAFYKQYGAEAAMARATASPVLGSLNSGMQLYRIRQQQPDLFQSIRVSLHLPQYLSYLFSGYFYSDITSIGCHTQLWDFDQHQYHAWVSSERIQQKLAPIASFQSVYHQNRWVGLGLHDSSAALIPYLKQFKTPFLLLSTGTWNIALHPFNSSPLTDQELQSDCLCYLTYEGKQVKSARLFAGRMHETRCQQLAERWQVSVDAYKTVKYNPKLIQHPEQSFDSDYHALVQDIVMAQVRSLRLLLDTAPVADIYVDGGFSNNEIFMQLLANALPDIHIYASIVAQASALGAALVLHSDWNSDMEVASFVEVRRVFSLR